MSFDYGSNDRDRDRDHSDRRGQGGYNNERDGGYSGGRTAVHDSYERDRENAREAGYDERGGYGEESQEDQRAGYGNDERFGENRNHSRAGDYCNDGRSNDDYISASHSRRNGREGGGDYERGGYGSGSNNDSNQSGEYQEMGYGRETRRENYNDNERQGYGGSGRRCKEQDEDRDTYSSDIRRKDDAPNNSASAAYNNNNSRDSHTGNLGLPGGVKSGSGAIDWQTVGTQVAVAGIQHFAKSYDKTSSINKEEQRKYDDADGVGGSQAKESAFAKKLGERKGETEKLGHETGDLKDKLVEGGLSFLKGAFGGRK
ncbi:hypothetical protein L211DRAFT_639168 [Terfezia boudieri ATCC MYA-4762]|uniref:Uncharacterized protein n=1 Tax=Terfezia boudieri ATCC MYA-4762 TaxID=1051890 RepID=A0A3N4LCZ3_9PEZI|nr:hypothetical protein L211DRAFT_639168 [Terfezia boudieri ATCC MYA-4762]